MFSFGLWFPVGDVANTATAVCWNMAVIQLNISEEIQI